MTLRYLLFALFLATLFTTPAIAAGKGPVTSGSFTLELDSLGLPHTLAGYNEYITGKINVEWELSTFLQEPWLKSTATWTWDKVIVIGLDGRQQSFNRSELPAEVRDSVDIIDIDIAYGWMEAFGGDRNLAILINPGILGKPYKKGQKLTKKNECFNLPESPDWDELFKITNSDAKDKNALRFATEAAAKKVVKDGFQPNKRKNEYIGIHSYKYSLYEVRRWLHDRERAEKRRKIQAKKDQKLARLNAQKQDEVNAVKRSRKAKKTDDFFAELDDGLDLVDIDNKYAAYARGIDQEFAEQFDEVESKYRAASDITNRQRSEAKAFLIAKRQEIENRPKQGESLIAFRVGDFGNYGYKTKSGTVVIPPQFRDAHDFIGGRASVEISEDKWVIINTKGDVLSESFYSLFQINKNRFYSNRTRKQNTYTILDGSGNKVGSNTYRGVHILGPNRIVISFHTHEGDFLADADGKLVSQTAFSSIDNFRDNKQVYFACIKDSGCGIINKNGEKVSSFSYINRGGPIGSGQVRLIKSSENEGNDCEDAGKRHYYDDLTVEGRVVNSGNYFRKGNGCGLILHSVKIGH